MVACSKVKRNNMATYEPGTPVGELAAQYTLSRGLETGFKSFHTIGSVSAGGDTTSILRSSKKLASYTIDVNMDAGELVPFMLNRTLLPTKIAQLEANIKIMLTAERWWELAVKTRHYCGNESLMSNDAHYRLIFDPKKLLICGVFLADIVAKISELHDGESKLMLWTPESYGTIDIIVSGISASNVFEMPPIGNIVKFSEILHGRKSVSALHYKLPKVHIQGEGLYHILKLIPYVEQVEIHAPNEVYRYFGIEAARERLFSLLAERDEEVTHVAETTADMLTQYGVVSKIGRASIEEGSVLVEMSLCNPKKDIRSLATKDRADCLCRAHAAVMLNSTAPVGTGYSGIGRVKETTTLPLDESILFPF